MVPVVRARVVLIGRRTGQGGFMLAATIGVLLFLAVTVVADLGFTLTVIRATTSQAVAATARRSGDSAMEVAVSFIRSDETGQRGTDAGGGACQGFPSNYSVTLPAIEGSSIVEEREVEVDCAAISDPAGRQVELEAQLDGRIVGSSRVRFYDSPGPGHRVVICDWLLGNASSGDLAACP